MALIKKQATTRAAMASNSSVNLPNPADPSRLPDSDQVMRDGTGEAEVKKEAANETISVIPAAFPGSQPGADAHSSDPQRPVPTATQNPTDVAPAYILRQPWEYIDEVVQMLKTASPLLILSMESIVDQINQRFKGTAEEEIYRLICMLLQDAIQVSADISEYWTQLDFSV
jgi:transformation/transcription domain-associated protein